MAIPINESKLIFEYFSFNKYLLILHNIPKKKARRQGIEKSNKKIYGIKINGEKTNQ